MQLKSTLLFVGMLTFHSIFAQNTDQPLPRFMTEEEKWLIGQSVPGQIFSSGITTPPSSPVRTMAEWEELQALVISWQSYSSILTEIVRAAREETNVIICCKDQSTLTAAQNYLTSKNVDISSNVTFAIIPNNTVWVRDYGPNCVYTNDVDSLLIVDWIYNRPRPQDDLLPEGIAQHLNLPLYATSAAPYQLVHTGGNFMSDGMGMGFSSDLLQDENGVNNQFGTPALNENQIDGVMSAFMGIESYPKMNKLPYDVIHHIDMHMKLLDEETLLVGQYPTGIADGPQIEANLQYVLSNFQTSFGTPFKVVRIPMPPDAAGKYPHQNGAYRTYANAVFVNKTILVPFYEQKYDTTAQRIWEEAMPGYKIVGINCNQIITALGAIHCITKEIGDDDPLRIVHQPLSDVTDNNVPGYIVKATMQHKSGIASGKLHYTTDLNGAWQTVDMNSFSSAINTWGAMIPVQPLGSTVYYYIEGAAVNGKEQVRPMPAPAGYWKFQILNSVGIDDPTDAKILDIYPNPAKAITCLPLYVNVATSCTIKLFDVLGQQLTTIFDGEVPQGHSNYFLDASNYDSGIYFIEFSIGKEKFLRKLIVE